MTPGSPSARRLSLLGCLLVAAAALALSACGSGGAATADNAPPAQPKLHAKEVGVVAVRPCPKQVDAFRGSLDTLRRQLAVGLSYEQYAAKMKSLGAEYDGIPIDRLTIECLSSTGTPSEKALNKYIDAVNAWGECLADAACTTASIEPVLQRKWRLASGFLSEAG
jgi:hypothetical protein